MRNITILECTLRDGSYTIDYQFTAEDTAIIAAGLEDAGFELIEIGHGLGLNASNAGEGVAASTDEEYLKAASSVLKRAKFGMFFIPGIGRKEDLEMAAGYGMDFVRIGTNAPEANKAEKYIKLAKKLGMIVSLNLMKSYVLSPEKLAEKARLIEEWGADIVYVVDSAGGMFPENIKEYVEAVRAKTKNIKIGLHAHNNLSLAIANTLAAIEAGATMVDSCLQGMGRSAGNTQSEILVLILGKLGYNLEIDSIKVMDLGKRLINPLLHKKGVDPIDVTSGYAMFHSKFLKNIYKAVNKYGLDPRGLIIESSKRSVVNVPEELVMSIAEELKEKEERRRTEISIRRIDFKANEGVLKVGEKTKKIAWELFSLSKKTRKKSIFSISTSNKGQEVIFPFIRENNISVIGNCEVNTVKQANEVIKAIDGIVDIILVDADKKIEGINLPCLVSKVTKKSQVISYKDTDAWAVAVDALISQITENIHNSKIVISGCNNPAIKVTQRLSERGARVTLCDENPDRLKEVVKGLNLIKGNNSINGETDKIRASLDADVIIGFGKEALISKEMLEKMNQNGLVMDAGVGTISPEGIEYALNSGLKTYRLDMRAGLSGEIITVLETEELLKVIAGKDKINGIPVVAGGFIGKRGNVVVDSISNPVRVVGIADGKGGLIKDMEEVKQYEVNIKRVKSGIAERMLKPVSVNVNEDKGSAP